jgi:hypothetical protein
MADELVKASASGFRRQPSASLASGACETLDDPRAHVLEQASVTPGKDDILDDLFHSCALHAFIDQAEEERGWPSLEGTRRRAYAYYEAELAKKNAAKKPGP